jgi:large subunit ribosomal protein L31
MKKDVHPKYGKVLFVDSTTGHKYLIGSTLKSDQKETYEGAEYPVLHVSISSSSHPYFVGGKQFVDTEGRVDRFNNRYKAAQQKAQERSEEEKKQKEEEKETKAKRKKVAAK